jgi:hypothetical protein
MRGYRENRQLRLRAQASMSIDADPQQQYASPLMLMVQSSLR